MNMGGSSVERDNGVGLASPDATTIDGWELEARARILGDVGDATMGHRAHRGATIPPWIQAGNEERLHAWGRHRPPADDERHEPAARIAVCQAKLANAQWLESGDTTTIHAHSMSAFFCCVRLWTVVPLRVRRAGAPPRSRTTGFARPLLR
jgi:hypothetical protein